MPTSTTITFLYECEVLADQAAAWEALFGELERVADAEPGTLAYRCYSSDDGNRVCLLEEYANSDAAITHMHGFGPNFGERFMAAVAIKRVLLLGTPSAALWDMIGPMFSGAIDGMVGTAYRAGNS